MTGRAAPHRPAPPPRTGTAPTPLARPGPAELRSSRHHHPLPPASRHPTMSNLNKDTEHTNGSGNVEEEVGTGARNGRWGWGSGERARRWRGTGMKRGAPGRRGSGGRARRRRGTGDGAQRRGRGTEDAASGLAASSRRGSGVGMLGPPGAGGQRPDHESRSTGALRLSTPGRVLGAAFGARVPRAIPGGTGGSTGAEYRAG